MKVYLIMAMTLDGKIAKDTIDKVDWTGKADKKKFVEITKNAGAVIMGSTTFKAVGQVLKGRKNIVMTRNPLTLLNNNHIDKQQTVGQNNTSNEQSFNETNLEFTDLPPDKILKSLEKQGFKSAALIGGSTINGLFAKENLIDEIYITIIPKLFGQGLPLMSLSETLDIDLELSHVETIDNNSILLKYNVIKIT